MYKVTLIPGDGIGPEVTSSAMRIIEEVKAPIKWDIINAGAEVYKETGHFIPEELLKNIEQNKIVLKGPITTPIGKGFRSINVRLRKRFDTYANIRPIKTIPGIDSAFQDVDMVVVRENTEGLYSGIEHKITGGVTEAIKVITKQASTKIVEFAFKYALENKRKKVTVVHKANIMKITDGLFLECAREVSKKYSTIQYEEKIVDNMCMQLVMHPHQYDVLVMPNLYGDILSDLASGLVGGLGVVPGANIGDDIGIFEAVHGSAPDIAGKNIANPIACIMSACMMLEYIGEKLVAQRIRKSVMNVINEGKCITKDLGGNSTTKEMTEEICKKLRNRFID